MEAIQEVWSEFNHLIGVRVLAVIDEAQGTVSCEAMVCTRIHPSFEGLGNDWAELISSLFVF
eukprot:1392303-Amorphochlora_amoeboformis.AAC.1